MHRKTGITWIQNRTKFSGKVIFCSMNTSIYIYISWNAGSLHDQPEWSRFDYVFDRVVSPQIMIHELIVIVNYSMYIMFSTLNICLFCNFYCAKYVCIGQLNKTAADERYYTFNISTN